MRDFLEEFVPPVKPVLIIGKGPSLQRISEFDLSDYYTVGLNDVFFYVAVDLASTPHIHELEAGHKYGEFWRAHEFLIPYYVWKGLDHWVPIQETPYRYLKMYCYNTDNPVPQVGDSQRIGHEFFSIHHVIELFALKGVKTFKTIGIDGGWDYAEGIDPIPGIKTPREEKEWCEKNGFQPISFDQQFRRINELVCKYNLDFKPLATVNERFSKGIISHK